jgi:hypothetical protein
MTEQPELYNLTNPNPHVGGDALKFIDTLIQAHEADVLEILENALWHFSNHCEGESTLSNEEMLKRLQGAIARIKGQTLNREIEESLGDVS